MLLFLIDVNIWIEDKILKEVASSFYLDHLLRNANVRSCIGAALIYYNF